jgi:hypothetical protein
MGQTDITIVSAAKYLHRNAILFRSTICPSLMLPSPSEGAPVQIFLSEIQWVTKGRADDIRRRSEAA